MGAAGCIADILTHPAFFFAAAGLIFAHCADRAFSAAVMGFMSAVIASPLDMASPDFTCAYAGLAAAAKRTRTLKSFKIISLLRACKPHQCVPS